MAQPTVVNKLTNAHPRLSRSADFLRGMSRSKVTIAGLIISIAYLILAIMDIVYPLYLGVRNDTSMLYFIPGQNVNSEPPSPPTFVHGWWFYFGTTISHIPIFPSMLAALRYDIIYSLLVVVAGALLGIVIGTIAAFFGGVTDETLMRITDIFLSVPFIPLAIAVTFFLGSTFLDEVYALIFVSWPAFARLARGETLTLRSSSFILAATSAGSSRLRNIFVHIVPNVLSPIFVQASLGIGRVVLIFATLDFLGIVRGDPYMPELGKLMVLGEQFLPQGQWWPIVVPGIFLVIFVVGINLLGDGLRDVLDPKLRT
ncbi:MAG: ABC transporter permease [Methanomassiliicoccales archaeon]